MDTRETIERLFGKNAVYDYNNLPHIFQQKYRLYITIRMKRNILFKNLFEKHPNTMSPTEWLDIYEDKKTFEYIAYKLNISKKTAINIYNCAIRKMKLYLMKKGIDYRDLLE